MVPTTLNHKNQSSTLSFDIESDIPLQNMTYQAIIWFSVVLPLHSYLILYCSNGINFHINTLLLCVYVNPKSSHLIYPLTMRVTGAPLMILQPVSSIFPCSPMPSGTWQTPGLSIPWCCLPTSSSVCLVFFPLSLCLARWFWPDQMNGKHDHTTASLGLFTMVRS